MSINESELFNISTDIKIKYITLTDEMSYFSHDYLSDDSMYFSILFLLDKNIFNAYNNSYPTVIKQFKLILNREYHCRDNKFFECITNIFYTNIVIFNDDNIYNFNIFYPINKVEPQLRALPSRFLILNKKNDIYYPVLDVNNVRKIFDTTYEYINNIVHIGNIDTRDITNLDIIDKAFNKDYVISNAVEYKKTELLRTSIAELREIAIKLNIEVRDENGKYLLKKNIIELIINA